MTFDWQTTYSEAIEAFGGDTPGAHLEQEILNSWRDHPQAVTNAIRKVAQGYTAGRIHSPWGALKAEIPKQISSDVQVGDGHERTRAIRNTEQFMRTAGLMFDRWSEVQDELYGERGSLRPWARDMELAERMEALWLELRPTGEQIEADELNRAEQWKANRAKLETMPKVPHPEPKATA